jgi:hypothetical protein
MPNFEQLLTQEQPVKLMLLGHNGSGKTGSLASLAAAGYKLRILDADKGIATLFSLLTNSKYPYKKYMEDCGISLAEAVSFISLDVPMANKTPENKTQKILTPKSASAFLTIGDMLTNWKDGETTYGNIETWGPDTILVLDSFTAISDLAYYYAQALGNQLGNMTIGNDYRVNSWHGQELIIRVMKMLTNSTVKCNVVILSHIEYIDDSEGLSRKPHVILDKGKEVGISKSTGYPRTVSLSLSLKIGSYLNDIYSTRIIGTGSSAKRVINTKTVDNILAKNSNYLDPVYPIETGLAQIFAALKQKPLPENFVASLNKHPSN